MNNKYMLRAYVYCHVQDLTKIDELKEKAINFCYDRNISIIGFCSCGVTSLIYLMIESKADTLLLNNHCLTMHEQRLLLSFCRRKNIAIIHFEK